MSQYFGFSINTLALTTFLNRVTSYTRFKLKEQILNSWRHCFLLSLVKTEKLTTQHWYMQHDFTKTSLYPVKWTKHWPVFPACLINHFTSSSHDRNICSAWCIFRHYLAARTRSPNTAEPQIHPARQQNHLLAFKKSAPKTPSIHTAHAFMSFYDCHSTVWT